jgi:preprotein translocase subunit Sec63
MTDKWDDSMRWWVNQPDMIKQMIRNVAIERLINKSNGTSDIGTSDVNHEVYHMYAEFQEFTKTNPQDSIITFLMDAS